MITRVKILALLLGIIILLSSCNNAIRNEVDYYAWINDEDNGLVVKKEINGFQLKMKYLPCELLAYKDYKANREDGINVSKQELLKPYENSLTFLFSISDTEDRDVLYYNVKSEEDFKAKYLNMSFNLKENLWISSGGKEIPPMLCVLEGTTDLKKSKDFYIVFTKTEDSASLFNLEELDLVFQDIFFDTGITHYKFQKEELNEIPTIGFW